MVLAPDGAPLAGAEVTLGPAPEEDGGPVAGTPAPPPTVTGEDGRWAWLRLAPGVWEIRVEARGYIPAEGRVGVPAAGAGEAVRIELRSLDEVPPAFAEGDPAGTVRRWLRRGDAFLDQGRPAEARAEYARVLRTPGVLSGAERAEVLETVARTHFLEGDREAAERALLAALLVVQSTPGESPDDERTARLRELYRVLLEGAGRGAEARELLARLDREPEAVRREHADELADLPLLGGAPEAPPEEREPAAPPPDRPVLPPEPHRRGAYRTAFPAELRSPLSDPGVVLARYGGEPEEVLEVDPSLGRYELPEETFEIYVPEGYRPAAEGGGGWGLLVWVSPTASGGIDGQGGLGDPERRAVLDEEGLLWVGANDAGNPRFTWNRVGLALDAAHAMAELYDLDPARVYAAGYSGGGRIASALALLFPEVFRGALALFGASFFRPVPVPDRPGSHWPPAFPAPPEETLRALRAESRMVLLTGERDFNRAQTRAVARALEEDGFRRVTYLEVPGATHHDLPDTDWLRRALRALEAPEGGAATP